MPVLDSIPHGLGVFVDANILVYALLNQSTQCLRFLNMCSQGSVAALTTTHVINETTHRLMIYEAYNKGIITKATAAALKVKPHEIKGLQHYWTQIELIFDLGIQIVDVHREVLLEAQRVRLASGLMTNDSIVVAVMHMHAISTLASADADFDLVAGLVRYAPDDLA